ncbi:hypothetical protein Tco_0257879 [Tanacetum coccineum]
MSIYTNEGWGRLTSPCVEYKTRAPHVDWGLTIPRIKGRRGSDSPKKGRVPMSERFLNPTPITQYSPVTNEVVKESGKEKPDVVVVNEKLDVMNENPDVVKEKPDFVKENPASVKENPLL